MTFLALSSVVACIAWTCTKEEVFREWREFCLCQQKRCEKWYEKKVFYLFLCEYCFSHWVTLGLLLLTRYKLVYTDWRGYFIAGFCIVAAANLEMTIYRILRLVTVNLDPQRRSSDARQ